MSYRAKALALAILFALFHSTIYAEDYITAALLSLQQSPVYVAPSTDNTDKDTAGKLQTRLTKDDDLILVMLPAVAETELKADITIIATRLSEGLGNQRIIGLAVGKKVIGYAPQLPVGVAADQMKRAESVSNDPVTALSTFVQNVHLWQAANPKPRILPFETPKEGGSPWLIWSGSFLGVTATSLVVMAIIRRRMRVQNTRIRTRFDAPDRVRSL
jgi:hypothetical protein